VPNGTLITKANDWFSQLKSEDCKSVSELAHDWTEQKRVLGFHS